MAGRKRKKQSSVIADVINLITAVALIVIAVLLVIFVFFYIRNNSAFEGVPFIGSLTQSHDGVKQSETAIVVEQESEAVIDDDLSSPGLTLLRDGTLVYVLSGDELSRYDEANITEYDGDARLLASSWLENGDDLYYFDADGHAVREYAEGAMRFAFSGDYILEKISYDRSWRGDSTTENADYPGLVRTKSLMAFLDDAGSAGGLCKIRFKKTTDSLTHELGGGANPQYTSKYAMSISGGYIYYLALADSSGSVPETIAGKLYRMMPGAEYRELVAEHVVGYKVLQTDRGAKVWYDDGESVKTAVTFEKDDSLRVFPEDGKYYVETESGRAVLMLEGGYPVTMKTSSFAAGNFVYALSGEGEILSVAPKTKVSLGGYTYSVENGEVFGLQKARVLRQDSKGTIETVSTEFMGSVGNLHYDDGTSRMIAEYTAENGTAGLLSISADGDVDILYDAADLGDTCVLYSLQDGNAVVKTGSSAEPFRKIRLGATYPLAVGIDPVVLETDDPTEEEAASRPAEYDDSVRGEKAAETQHPGEITADSPSSEVTIIGPGEASGIAPGSDSAPSPVSGGPGSDASAGTGIINDNVVEKKGPGES